MQDKHPARATAPRHIRDLTPGDATKITTLSRLSKATSAPALPAEPAVYACPTCKDAGWLRRERDGVQVSELVLCSCQEEAARTRHLESLLGMSGLNKGARGQTFANFRTGRPDLMAALQTCWAFAEEPDGWVYLHGGYGCGKSHLLAATAMRLMEQRVGALYVVVPELLDQIRRTFNGGDESFDTLWNRILSCDVLLLDDLGAEKSSEWVTERLYTLINRRYADRSPLMVASNLAPSKIGGRIGSRLGDVRLTTVIGLEAGDYRKGATA